jgi:hypothetical protein
MQSLFLDESRLYRMWVVHRAETLDCGYLMSIGFRDWCYTRANRFAIQKHRAGATLREATAELRSVQLEIVLQHIQQWSIRLHIR